MDSNRSMLISATACTISMMRISAGARAYNSMRVSMSTRMSITSSGRYYLMTISQRLALQFCKLLALPFKFPSFASRILRAHIRLAGSE
jgi:hypothetical protein